MRTEYLCRCSWASLLMLRKIACLSINPFDEVKKSKNCKMSPKLQKPRGRCTPYAFFLNVCRIQCSKKLTKEVDFKTLSSVCWEKWQTMSEFHKRRFVQMSKYDDVRYEKEMMEYKNKNRTATFYSKEEDKQLLEALNRSSSGDWKKVDMKDIKKLSFNLQRSTRSIRNRLRILQKGSLKRQRIQFNLEEDKMIIDSAIEGLKEGKSLQETSLPYVKLAELLHREDTSVFNRWIYIRMWLLQYYAKTLNLDVRPMLVNILADNFASVEAVDWNFVLTFPEFSGHTAASLKRKLHIVIRNICMKMKITPRELSLKQIRTHIKAGYNPQAKNVKSVERRQGQLISYFEQEVQLKNMKNFI